MNRHLHRQLSPALALAGVLAVASARPALAQSAAPAVPAAPVATSGRAPTPAAATLRMTLADAEARAVAKNPTLASARLGTEAATYTVAEARSAYSPVLTSTFLQRSQTSPSTSQLAGGQTSVSTEASTYSTGVAQDLPWGGGRMTVDFTGSRNATSNVFSTYNPSFASGISASVTQPLLRGFRFDAPRAAIAQADLGSEIADTQLRQQMATVLANVRRAYWTLVYTTDALSTAQASEVLAQQQLTDNQLRVRLGTVAPIDVVEAESEVATRHQAVVAAQGDVRDAQVALKGLLVGDPADALWSQAILPTDRPESPEGRSAPLDVAAAITAAVANRSDAKIARSERASAAVQVRLLDNLRAPAVDLVAGYGLNGIGGTQILRDSSTLGGGIAGTIPGSYLDVLRSIGAFNYPTWSVGLNVTLPIGRNAADATYARARVEQRQRDVAIQALDVQIAAQVTRIAEQVRTSEEQVTAAAAARQLAQARLDAEQARRSAGLSTNFLVLQAQRDLTIAQTNELRAQLDLRTALVDFDLVQVAPVG